MDGAKRIRNSLQFRLSVQLTAGLVLFSVVTGAISFFRIHDEAEELMDRELRQVAMLVLMPPRRICAGRLSYSLFPPERKTPGDWNSQRN